jgi:hypothetical protein
VLFVSFVVKNLLAFPFTGIKERFPMVPKRLKAPDREALLTAIRAAAKTDPAKVLTLARFLAISKMGAQNVFRHFSKWNQAVRAAGLKYKRHNDPVTSRQMLEDWGRLARKVRRTPTHLEYKLHGKYCSTTVMRRFGKWSLLPDTFRDFARRSKQWSDVLTLLPPKGAPDNAYRRRNPHEGRRLHERRAGRFPDRPVCGPRIPLDSLSHAPVNEAGVLFLFALMARQLGFIVESLRAGFPDCEAKRLVGPGEWQTVRIEFEYESRNFNYHRHKPEECDMIVCWTHNWPECPKNIEVIALSEEVKRLSAALVPA